MESVDLLHRAISEARSGRKSQARELFQKVVYLDPRNELAWMWLAGLFERVEDRIAACEQVLVINPANAPARAYLEKLRREKKSSGVLSPDDIEGSYRRASALDEKGDRQGALDIIRQLLESDYRQERAWLLVAQLSDNLHEQISGLEKALAINPSNTKTRAELKRLRYFEGQPADFATWCEEQGKFEQALAIYQQLAAQTKDSAEFDRIYHNITRLENLKQIKIKYIPPVISIARLTAGPPLLYIMLVLLQVGLNPFSYPAPHLWLGFLWVLLGGFLVALAAVRSRHAIWEKGFGEAGAGGSPLARFILGLVGWLIVLLPHVFLFLDSMDRLAIFQIPPIPGVLK
jgi:tetratricopeptide (TPR) repeat protein